MFLDAPGALHELVDGGVDGFLGVLRQFSVPQAHELVFVWPHGEDDCGLLVWFGRVVLLVEFVDQPLHGGGVSYGGGGVVVPDELLVQLVFLCNVSFLKWAAVAPADG